LCVRVSNYLTTEHDILHIYVACGVTVLELIQVVFAFHHADGHEASRNLARKHNLHALPDVEVVAVVAHPAERTDLVGRCSRPCRVEVDDVGERSLVFIALVKSVEYSGEDSRV